MTIAGVVVAQTGRTSWQLADGAIARATSDLYGHPQVAIYPDADSHQPIVIDVRRYVVR